VLRATLYEHEIRRAIGMPGEGDFVVDGVAALDAPEDRCLYFIDHKVTTAVRESLAARNGCIVIVRRGSVLVGALGRCRVLEVAHPRAAIASILGFIRIEQRQPPWVDVRKIAREAVISPLAVVQGNVEIGEGVVVEPFCTVGPDVVIRRRSILRAGARVNQRVSIDEESVIGANAVVGSEGFGFVRDEAGNKTRIPHLGGIIIGSPLVAYAAATTVSSGGTLLIATGTGSGVTLASGAQAVIGQGGVLAGAVVDNGTLTFSGGVFAGSLTGGGSLIVPQFQIFALNGPQNFAGAVTVKGGTLVLNGADTISGAVTISGGALVVNGAETFGSAINISGATLEIGSSGTAGAVPRSPWAKLMTLFKR